MQHLNRLLTKLQGVRQTSTGWVALCPCPDHGKGGKGDHNPSLAIAMGDDNKILVHCQVGCPTDLILEAIEMDFSDLWPAKGDLGDADHKVISQPRGRAKSGAEANLCDQINRALLTKLTLSDRHRNSLTNRGLRDDEIDRRGYRSLSKSNLRQATAKLTKTFGDQLLCVPGFAKVKQEIAAVSVPDGILIPVRDVRGRIRAFQIRRDGNGNGSKYLWFSGGATSSGAPAHVPLGVEPASELRVTEGTLKADVAFALDGVPTIGIPGVAHWRAALPVLEQLAPVTIVLAFDSDAQSNKSVANDLKELY
jgi:hypothetical protein